MSSNIFNTREFDKIPANDFDLSHTNLTTMKFGELVPTSLTEVMPGDKIKMSSNRLSRLMPLIAPIMGNIKIYEEWFFVPNRILWKNWEKFITQDTDLAFPIVETFKQGQIPPRPEKSLLNYFGVGFDTWSHSSYISAMPLAAYVNIYNEYYREQSITEPIACELIDDIQDDESLGYQYWYPPLLRAYKKDYFTAALPAAQKGNPILMPLTRSNQIDVYLNSKLASWDIMKHDGTSVGGSKPLQTSAPGGSSFGIVEQGDTNRLKFDPDGTLSVNVNNQAVTIETLRAALALQSFLEKDARGGVRYTESLNAHFGVNVPDYRVDRPEYIGRNVSNMLISEVMSQAETINQEGDTVNPVGQMAGHGVEVSSSDNLYYQAYEHGYLMCITSVVPQTIYASQGIDKHFKRFTRLEFPFPTFANLGEQAITKGELAWSINGNPEIFGYIPQYSEMKYHTSKATGQFLTDLEHWTIARKFDPDTVELNGSFLYINPDDDSLTKIFAVQDGSDYVVMQQNINMFVNRRLPRYGIPHL